MLLKYIRIIFQYLLLATSYAFPRNKKIWCFGASFVGNAKYLFLFMNNHYEKKRCIWIADNKKNTMTIRNKGYEAYRRWSIKGIWYCLIAGVYVYNSYPSNVNLYTKGRAKLINLWHGVGLKKMDRQIKTGPMAKIFQSRGVVNKLRYLNFRITPDLMLSTSPLQTAHFQDAINISKDRIVEGIYPRCNLFRYSDKELLNYIKNNETSESIKLVELMKCYDYVYIYMPTFRDSGDDFLGQSGFDFKEVNNIMLSQNKLLILKFHPDTQIQLASEYTNILTIDKDVDIYPLLPFTNCLITDYSSIYFDYILMKDKQIILFLPDYKDYIANSRELFFDYDAYTKGMKAYTFTEFVQLLKMDKNQFSMPDIEKIRNLFWNPQCNTIEQLVETFNKRLDLTDN